jgi:hypothetical protein
MTRPKPKHMPCSCGCGELADECMNPGNRTHLGAFGIEPAIGSRRDWFADNYEAAAFAPTDPDERAAYAAQLVHEAEHGPADDPHDPQNVRHR